MKHKNNNSEDSLSKYTGLLSLFSLLLPIMVALCSCGTAVANECRINPYASNTRRIVTAVLVYTLAFLTLIGGVATVSVLGIYSYGEYKKTAQLLNKFVDLKSCSDIVLDLAGEKGTEMTASENRLYLIAFLSLLSGVLILVMFVTVLCIPFYCRSSVDESHILVTNQINADEKS